MAAKPMFTLLLTRDPSSGAADRRHEAFASPEFEAVLAAHAGDRAPAAPGDPVPQRLPVTAIGGWFRQRRRATSGS